MHAILFICSVIVNIFFFFNTAFHILTSVVNSITSHFISMYSSLLVVNEGICLHDNFKQMALDQLSCWFTSTLSSSEFRDTGEKNS